MRIVISAFSLLAVAFAIMLVTACRDVDDPLDVPPDLVELRETAVACGRDAMSTYVERSEHCVLTVEGLTDQSERCPAEESRRCLNRENIISGIQRIYQTAVIDSLFLHGKSDEVARLRDGDFAMFVYHSRHVMRSLFEQCLETEEEALEQQGLTRIHGFVLMPLAKGQRCFRKGHPKFRTRPIALL